VGEGRGRWRRLPRRPQTAIASRRRWRGATGEACARAVHGGGAEAGCGVLWQVVVVVLLLLLLLVMVMVLVLVLVLVLMLVMVLVMVLVIVLVRAGRLAAQAGGAPPPHHGALPRARPRAG
jgi:Flp pilus assembly protein TadB